MSGYILIAVMAFLNACMDAFENENYFESIFKHWRQSFWYKRESWKWAKKLGGYKFDSWHITKTLWVVFLSMLPFCKFNGPWWVVVAGVWLVWNLIFRLFYHVIFKIK